MRTTNSARNGWTSPFPSELSEGIPRDVRLTAGGMALTVVAIAMAVGAIATAIGMSVVYTQAEERHEPGSFPFWMIPLVSISLLVLSALTGRSVRRQWTLLSEGRVALARVSAHKRIQTDKRRGYRVSCEFQDFSGATRLARYDTGKNPPPIGTVVPLVYHRDNPQWNAAYPLQLVRPSRDRQATPARRTSTHGVKVVPEVRH